MKRAIGYVRVSSQQQANEGQSLEVQEDLVMKYFEYRLAPAGYVWEGIIRDPAVSARVPLVQRPGGCKLDGMIDKGDVVVFSKLDRGFRDSLDLLATVKSWDARGVAVHMLDLGIDISTDIGKLTMGVMGLVAEWERKRFVERSVEGKRRKQATGKTMTERYIGGHPPWGFKLEKRKGKCHIVPDPEQRKWASWFLELWRKGFDYHRIWLYCLEKRIFRTNRKGEKREWNPGTIRLYILKELALRASVGIDS